MYFAKPIIIDHIPNATTEGEYNNNNNNNSSKTFSKYEATSKLLTPEA
jgi:hypothetical protein